MVGRRRKPPPHTAAPAPAEVVPVRLAAADGRSFVLDRPRVVAGRAEGCDVVLSAADVSRRHCRFEFAHGVWRVCDLGSLNGVYLNGERVLSAELSEGDRLAIAGCQYTVEAVEGLGAGGDPASKVLRSILAELARPSEPATRLRGQR